MCASVLYADGNWKQWNPTKLMSIDANWRETWHWKVAVSIRIKRFKRSLQQLSLVCSDALCQQQSVTMRQRSGCCHGPRAGKFRGEHVLSKFRWDQREPWGACCTCRSHLVRVENVKYIQIYPNYSKYINVWTHARFIYIYVCVFLSSKQSATLLQPFHNQNSGWICSTVFSSPGHMTHWLALHRRRDRPFQLRRDIHLKWTH